MIVAFEYYDKNGKCNALKSFQDNIQNNSNFRLAFPEVKIETLKVDQRNHYKIVCYFDNNVKVIDGLRLDELSIFLRDYYKVK
ncbi:hypothetical protein Nekkels1_62 [Cellulophaga phage Nekkels_1]|uniref:Uncharacterized protein n=1 Tax=Cellulophaga phage Nekkels_1 TaxID=2745692 RepID=A0A8E4UXI2_9CAUD|nr:hypothetical protein M1M31_gp62 [Cellulophaga phage Nekkels_1]QQO97066.1 hypothetical protein Nekkels1_62 [Cellulophaga phage Nekkels_1]